MNSAIKDRIRLGFAYGLIGGLFIKTSEFVLDGEPLQKGLISMIVISSLLGIGAFLFEEQSQEERLKVRG